MNIILSGSDGQLGKSIPALNNKKYNIIALNKNEFDITNSEKIKFYFNKYNPKILINTAAYTNVDKAEEDFKKAYEVNCYGVKNLALNCYLNNCLLIHFSTDYVFDGFKNSPYDETDLPNPLSQYAKSKLAGENEVIKSKCKYLIIRIGWLYSHHNTENFLNKMINLSKTNSELKIIMDQKGVPTSTLELSRNLWAIIEKLKDNNEGLISNIYHFSQNGNIISFYDFANFIFNYMKLKNHKIPLIQPILSRNYSKKSIRPLFSALNNSKLSEAYNLNIERWDESLEKILNIKFTN
mgnify:CR=1 FL=1|tara:strand:+ start:693 stop:1577 length:885 start_codon:yes stop_codon:yes gene_type:complete